MTPGPLPVTVSVSSLQYNINFIEAKVPGSELRYSISSRKQVELRNCRDRNKYWRKQTKVTAKKTLPK